VTDQPRIKPEIITALREWAEFEQDGGNVEQGAAIDIILDWYDRQTAALASPPMPGRGEGFVLVPVEAFTEKLNRLSAIITELAGEVKAGGPEDRAWAIINELLAASRPKEDTHAK
jgi:hypothetical protein